MSGFNCLLFILVWFVSEKSVTLFNTYSLDLVGHSGINEISICLKSFKDCLTL